MGALWLQRIATYRFRCGGVRNKASRADWIKRPLKIIVVKFSYYGGEALHIESQMLSIRLCLLSLRTPAMHGGVPRDTLVLGLAADRPQDVARIAGFPMHSRSDWPSGCLLSMHLHDEHILAVPFQVRFPARTDGGQAYVKLDAEGCDDYTNFKVRRARHPFRGTEARARWAAALHTFAEFRKARDASGRSWDNYIEHNHRLKDFKGHVLLSRRYLKKLCDSALAPPRSGALRTAIEGLAE